MTTTLPDHIPAYPSREVFNAMFKRDMAAAKARAKELRATFQDYSEAPFSPQPPYSSIPTDAEQRRRWAFGKNSDGEARDDFFYAADQRAAQKREYEQYLKEQQILLEAIREANDPDRIRQLNARMTFEAQAYARHEHRNDHMFEMSDGRTAFHPYTSGYDETHEAAEFRWAVEALFDRDRIGPANPLMAHHMDLVQEWARLQTDNVGLDGLLDRLLKLPTRQGEGRIETVKRIIANAGCAP